MKAAVKEKAIKEKTTKVVKDPSWVAIETHFEHFAQLINKLDSVTHSLEIPMRSDFRVQAMKAALPEIVREFKETFTSIADVNLWDDKCEK